MNTLNLPFTFLFQRMIIFTLATSNGSMNWKHSYNSFTLKYSKAESAVCSGG